MPEKLRRKIEQSCRKAHPKRSKKSCERMSWATLNKKGLLHKSRKK